MLAHSTRLVDFVNPLSWLGSAAKDFTTRIPLAFSSTIVATSARRDCTTHEIGNMSARIRTPDQNTKGMVDMATKDSGTLIRTMKMNAMTTRPMLCAMM